VTSERAPRVSVGLPVYNGEPYLQLAIDAVLSQTFEDLELIVYDNASDDNTEQICRAAARGDRRVRYQRHDRNLGASRNFNLTFRAARGEYFRWMSADDEIDPACLDLCVEQLDNDPSAVLCHTQVRVIDRHGADRGDFEYPLDHADHPQPSRRFRDALDRDRWCFEVFGLIRSDALRRTRLLDRYVGSDRVLRAELALLGRYRLVAEPLFRNRDHPDRSVRALPAHHLRGAWFDPALEGRRLFPHWRILSEYARAIARAPVGWSEKGRCDAALLRWLRRDSNWARLGADLVIGVAPGTWELMARRRRSRESWLES